MTYDYVCKSCQYAWETSQRITDPAIEVCPSCHAKNAQRLVGGGGWSTTVENLDVICGLVVLDTWLLNCDRFRVEGAETRRNTRNVFMGADGAGKGKFRLVAMDHTHCFTCGRTIGKSIKSIDRVKDTRLYGHFPEFRPHLKHEVISRFSAHLRTFTRHTAQAIVTSTPSAWRPEAEAVAAVVEFLADRADFVGQNVRKMLVDQGELQPQLELEA